VHASVQESDGFIIPDYNFQPYAFRIKCTLRHFGKYNNVHCLQGQNSNARSPRLIRNATHGCGPSKLIMMEQSYLMRNLAISGVNRDALVVMVKLTFFMLKNLQRI
jgi:hypothetical protein